MKKLILAAAAALALAGCGGDDDEAAETPTPSGPAALGETRDVGDLRVTVLTAELPDVETVDLTARWENPSGSTISQPDFNVVCADGSEGGRRNDTRPGALVFAPIEAGASAEGTVLLAVPAGCEPEAVQVTATGAFVGGQPEPVRWELP